MEQRIQARLRVLDRAIFEMRPRKRNELSLQDIALHVPGVKDVMELPRDHEVTTASFDFLREVLPGFEEKWKADARQYLCDQAREVVSSVDGKSIQGCVDSVYGSSALFVLHS